MKILILLLFINETHAQRIKMLAPAKRYSQKRVNSGKQDESLNLKRILEQNQRIEQLLRAKKRSKRPFIGDSTAKSFIPTGTVLRAHTLNPILSLNLKGDIYIKVNPGEPYFAGRRLKCRGSSENDRVYTDCELLIGSAGELEVSVSALNLDGTAGLVGEVYDGKDQEYAKKYAGSFLKGALSVIKSKIGKSKKKDDLLKTGVNEFPEITTALIDSESTKPTKITFIEAGTKVLLIFNRRLNYETH